MADRPNPLKLNPLQAKTLALLQELARQPSFANPPDAEGTVLLRYLPEPHGDHFHIGHAVVRSSDATGLSNPAVYGALARKGLILAGPAACRSSRRPGSPTIPGSPTRFSIAPTTRPIRASLRRRRSRPRPAAPAGRSAASARVPAELRARPSSRP